MSQKCPSIGEPMEEPAQSQPAQTERTANYVSHINSCHSKNPANPCQVLSLLTQGQRSACVTQAQSSSAVW